MVYNLINSTTRRCFYLKKFDHFIEANVEWFIDKPLKRWTLAKAMADYITTFNPKSNVHVEKILKDNFDVEKPKGLFASIANVLSFVKTEQTKFVVDEPETDPAPPSLPIGSQPQSKPKIPAATHTIVADLGGKFEVEK